MPHIGGQNSEDSVSWLGLRAVVRPAHLKQDAVPGRRNVRRERVIRRRTRRRLDDFNQEIVDR